MAMNLIISAVIERVFAPLILSLSPTLSTASAVQAATDSVSGSAVRHTVRTVTSTPRRTPTSGLMALVCVVAATWTATTVVASLLDAKAVIEASTLGVIERLLLSDRHVTIVLDRLDAVAVVQRIALRRLPVEGVVPHLTLVVVDNGDDVLAVLGFDLSNGSCHVSWPPFDVGLQALAACARRGRRPARRIGRLVARRRLARTRHRVRHRRSPVPVGRGRCAATHGSPVCATYIAP